MPDGVGLYSTSGSRISSSDRSNESIAVLFGGVLEGLLLLILLLKMNHILMLGIIR